MKKLRMLIPVLVLTTALLVGCGCRNNKPMNTMPTTLPTVATTEPTTEMTTRPTTMPTTQPETEPTLEDGNGPLGTDSTKETGSARGGNYGSGSGITGSITGSK